MVTEDGSSTITVEANNNGSRARATEQTSGVKVEIDKIADTVTFTLGGVSATFPASVASHIHDCLGRVM